MALWSLTFKQKGKKKHKDVTIPRVVVALINFMFFFKTNTHGLRVNASHPYVGSQWQILSLNYSYFPNWEREQL